VASTRSTLAIDGGPRVRPADRPWPTWPRYTDAARREVEAVLESGRWAISGPWTGEPCRERRFAEQFAAFHRVDHGAAITSSGDLARRHRLLLGDDRDMDDVVRAFHKVWGHLA
jgi:dTDP-4-amino-4,6-dideoxygalactose transaminase